MAPATFAFVEAGDFGRPKATDRKLIRSHCMLGKNKKRDAADENQQPVVSRATRMRKRNPRPAESKRLSRSPRYAASTRSSPEVKSETDSFGESICPPSPPSGISFPRLALDLDDQAKDLLFSYYLFSKEHMYPVEHCIDFELDGPLWFQWLFEDVAFLQAALISAYATNDSILYGREMSTRTVLQMRNTLSALKSHLSDTVYSMRDSTVAVVLSLAVFADYIGDSDAVAAHIVGLKEMIRLRGGLEAFRHNSKLFIKLSHMDLAVNLSTGSPPPFWSEPVSWAPLFEKVPPLCANCSEPLCCLNTIKTLSDKRLVNVFRDLQHFTRLLNLASSGKSTKRMRDIEFQTILNSIQYRLINLQGTQDSLLAECLRLAMLAFVTTTFALPGKRPVYEYLTRQFQECFDALDATLVSRDMMLWMLVVASMSIFEGHEPWFVEKWAKEVPADLDWSLAKQRLQVMMWIDVVQDSAGCHMFNTMRGSSDVQVHSPPYSGFQDEYDDDTEPVRWMMPPVLRRDRF